MCNISAGPNPEAALATAYICSFQSNSLTHHRPPAGLRQVSSILCQTVFHLQNRNDWRTVQLHGNILKVNTIKTPNHEFYKVEENRRGCLEPQFCQFPLPTKISNRMTAHDKKKDLATNRAMPFPKHKLYNTRTLQQHVCVSAVQVELVWQRFLFFLKKEKL